MTPKKAATAALRLLRSANSARITNRHQRELLTQTEAWARDSSRARHDRRSPQERHNRSSIKLLTHSLRSLVEQVFNLLGRSGQVENLPHEGTLPCTKSFSDFNADHFRRRRM